ncbi:phage tail sheath family protein [Bradyrhizobium sp. 2TAF24]|uniref:phage tail sheath family protein n=1 Tax=Bradyrhizobium sp. 2TAF24 TaxID=3233011 RepID=UPI003F905D49
MTVQYKTPGVYVQELDAFPPSIVGVETAVPVFIGYTRTAEKAGRPMKLRPLRISSMVEYVAVFGDAPTYQFALTAVPAAKAGPAAASAGPPAAQGGDAAAKVQVADNSADSKTHDAAPNDPNAPKDETKASTAADPPHQGEQGGSTDAKPDDHTAAPENQAAAKTDPDAPKAPDTAPAAAVADVPHDVTIGGKAYGIVLGKVPYLYNCLRLFYANGGGDCYIVSVGSYDDVQNGGISLDALKSGLDAVRDLVGPTMLVIPEAMQLEKSNCATLTSAMLSQCYERQDRVAILDVWGIDQLPATFTGADLTAKITDFRSTVSGLESQWLKYGMAYAPFLNTSIVDASEVSFLNLDATSRNNLASIIEPELAQLFPDQTKIAQLKTDFTNQLTAIGKLPDGDAKTQKFKQLNQNLVAQVPVFKDIYTTMAAKLGTLPPSAAMAGIYTLNDTTRGVWNAPANVGLIAVTSPTIAISNRMQDDLNMPIDGLAVNAIRDFVGRGTVVWGARTLDGNSNDWRYIQVRRALIYIEQSVELALNKFVFEPNVAQTWATVSSMISSFLRGLWSAGGLMGATPQEAFTVQCGLGSTMTAQDVLEGRMIVQIKLQMVHPAEFIVLAFQQQMQGAA